jgi:hypothetical protein
MRRYEILRVDTKEDLLALVRKQRVTVYRNSVSPRMYNGFEATWPSFLEPEPVTIQL